MLSELLNRQITTSICYGDTFIKKRIGGRKVFIVLDDVHNTTQLEYLCGELDDLGANSRLIFTTRDRHALRGRVDTIHEVTKWSWQDSLKFFILEAFKHSHPKKGYESVLKQAVAYAGGFPLALKVLGSHFYSRSPAFWESELNYLKNKGECFDEIQQVLQVKIKILPQRYYLPVVSMLLMG
ncbi:hypothetical protein TSUD_357250 [Trifolium subterraneum]|uniref:NB-ARC domain-containing protein n=1 Tax=Trifolium subterraneum TaxID=3900 RepID=A0A2Z6MNA0_TRISU|nr:hypothetical protein TSUD_357250 [Trifolium subterraneum]